MPRWNVHFDMRVDNSSVELRTLVANIHAVSRLTGDIPLPPAVERQLNALNIHRAVRGTTGIEGARLTTDEIQQILERPTDPVLPAGREREEVEARNAAEVMEYIARSSENRISESLISTIHRLTTQGIDYPDNIPGVYRSHQPSAGGYLPPETNEEIRRLMREFIEWINSGERLGWDPVVCAIVSHFYVVNIHPFGDGNGRTSRGIESFLLYRGGVNVRGFYSLANFYYENRSDYYQNLDRARFETDGDLTPFVLFALRGLESELQSVRDGIVQETKWIAFRDFAREIIFGPEGPQTATVALRLFKLAIGIPREGIAATELKSAAASLSSGYGKLGARTLARDVIKLVELELWRPEGTVFLPNAEVMDTFTVAALPDGD
ncbi:MAG: Fic family protein [Chloroflexi bacterium]|nr:Fic family protein [Chloroflexota bacterium]